MTFKPNVIFLPCGHQYTCQQWYDAISKVHSSCPLCQKTTANKFISEITV
jgi:hypothetical protein